MNRHSYAAVLLFLIGLIVSTCPIAANEKPGNSPYAGQYSGPYTFISDTLGDQKGKGTIAIADDGKVTGNVENETLGIKGKLSGSVTDDGDVTLVLDWGTNTFEIKGTAAKNRSSHLTGTLNQYSGKKVVGVVRMNLQTTK
jgi:hypothetical protein